MTVYRGKQQAKRQLVRHIGLFVILLAVLAAARSGPARDYAEAVARIEERQAADDSVVTPGGRSIFMSQQHRTPTVFVLLHGFTNSPGQFQELGTWLAGRLGYAPPSVERFDWLQCTAPGCPGST